MRVINHKLMRRIVGYIAFFMPFIVVWASGREGLSSISISYWTDSQTIFVGCLVAVGFFLAAYNGAGGCERTEKWLSRAACVFALIVAFFPTTGFECDPGGPPDCVSSHPPAWISTICEFFGFEPHVIHNVAAISLFVCLFLMLLFFSFRASRKGKPGRSMAYLGFSLGMLIVMPALYLILEKLFTRYDTVFWVEWLGLGLFGAGWFVAGRYRTELLEVPPGAVELITIPGVNPTERNVPTGIDVDADKQYFFVAKGCWKDWYLRCGPAGWGAKWNPFARKNRIKWEPFFVLCGNVGKSVDKDLNFRIGEKGTWPGVDEGREKADQIKEKVKDSDDRELYLFANDWDTDSAYGNNKELKPHQGGPLTVTIYELTGDEVA